jgi:hypothetical protein
MDLELLYQNSYLHRADRMEQRVNKQTLVEYLYTFSLKVIPMTFFISGIDREFEALLDSVFGNELMAHFRSRRPAAHAELMAAFEARKRGAAPGHDRAVALHPPFAFIDFLRKQSGKDVSYCFV